MAITLYHHPWSRAATVVWMLEEVGVDYELEWVDLRKGEQKKPRVAGPNPMGKVPLLVDGEAIVTESAAIAVYLADRYAPGRLAPALDDPARGTFLRWSFYAPSVIEPGCMAHSSGWDYAEGSAGWGNYEAMLDTIEAAIGDGPWLLGDRFTMADIVFGGTVRWMVGFGMMEKRSAFLQYIERMNERPAQVKAAAINQAIVEERGLKR